MTVHLWSLHSIVWKVYVLRADVVLASVGLGILVLEAQKMVIWPDVSSLKWFHWETIKSLVHYVLTKGNHDFRWGSSAARPCLYHFSSLKGRSTWEGWTLFFWKGKIVHCWEVCVVFTASNQDWGWFVGFTPLNLRGVYLLPELQAVFLAPVGLVLSDNLGERGGLRVDRPW